MWLQGMPVLQAWKSKQVIVMKRGLASGYGDIFFQLGNVPVLTANCLSGCSKSNVLYAWHENVIWGRERHMRGYVIIVIFAEDF
jgi:hypothetical protein